MNKAELQKSGAGYGIATVGDLSSFEGKAFVKDVLGTTSIELSFGTLAPDTSVPFFHHHKQNEEVYVVLRALVCLSSMAKKCLCLRAALCGLPPR